MTTDLEPPRVPPLTAAERARLRNRLMERARPTNRRPLARWAAPVVGVGAVAAVVAGTLVVTSQSPDAGVAGPSGPIASPAAKVGVDLGTVPATDVAKLLASCQFPDETGRGKLVWSRHVRGITTDSTMMVALAVNPQAPGKAATTRTPPRSGDRPTGDPRKPGSGGAPDFAKLGYRYCMMRTPPSAEVGASASVGRVSDKGWKAEPTAQHALVTLAVTDGDFTMDLRTLQAWRLYRAHPDVAKVEARYVLNGKPGPWTSGVVTDGFAYTEVQAGGKFTSGQRLTTEVRAFDAHGKQLPTS
ncbi:hypothetical protein [Kribbella solani]|uniref:hypothetical protein n=1 Tax=Kribbella solani TaxID=236067 RepID=UPI0031E1D509